MGVVRFILPIMIRIELGMENLDGGGLDGRNGEFGWWVRYG